AHHGGYDALVQAMSGFMSITGPRDGDPHKVGVAIVDVLTGLQATNGVLAALHARTDPSRFDRFRHVEVALSDAALAGLVNVAACRVNDLESGARWGNEHPTIVPYAPFPSADGFVFIAVGSDGQWDKLTEALALFEDWGDGATAERWRTNRGRVDDRERLHERLAEVTRGLSSGELENRLARGGVPCGPIRSIEEALADLDVERRGLVVQHADGSRTVASPIRWGAESRPHPVGAAPPHLGSSNERIWREFGGSERRGPAR
ncbi:MAG: CoA transferase, partial [Planctomycetes bacterium]|nr:CoA transferase [Planctomycetota bacterium]